MRTRALGVAVAACFLVLGGAVPASAHDTQFPHIHLGGNWSTYRTVANEVVIHDGECDSQAAFVEWNWTGMADEWKNFPDPNGCDGSAGVANEVNPPSGAEGIQIRTCENFANKQCNPAQGQPGVEFDK